MKKDFIDTWIRNSHKRNHLFAWLAFVFIFLFPVLGWNPLLLLWTINACFSYKEAGNSKIRYIHALLAVIFTLLLVSNLIVRIKVFFQYYGYFI